jgi:hypothetical protein
MSFSTAYRAFALIARVGVDDVVVGGVVVVGVVAGGGCTVSDVERSEK